MKFEKAISIAKGRDNDLMSVENENECYLYEKSFYDTDFRLEARDQINEWIRTSGKFDAVIDFDASNQACTANVSSTVPPHFFTEERAW